MTTVIAIDLSVSMIRPFKTEEGINARYSDCGSQPTEPITLLELAKHGVGHLLNLIAAKAKFEYVSVVTFSTECDVLVPFTRDYESIKTKIKELEFGGSTCYPLVIQKINDLVLAAEWDESLVCNVIMITDGNCYEEIRKPDIGSFSFLGKLAVVALEGVPSCYTNNYETNILPNNLGSIFSPNLPLTVDTVSETFKKLFKETYAPHIAVLQCGHLKSDVQLFPIPLAYTQKLNDDEQKIYTVPNELSIIGFLEMSDVKCPAILSRHRILSKKSSNKQLNTKSSKTPSFCVLLQKSLEKENMAAVCQLDEDWYGLLLSWVNYDTNKSYLILALLEIGSNAIPWLGDLQNLTLLPTDEPESNDEPPRKKSYSQPNLCTIDESHIQFAVKKLLKMAGKIPIRTQSFYKELNRIRSSAIAYGFQELLIGIANLLDEESNHLSSSDSKCLIHLCYASAELRKPSAMDSSYTIEPVCKSE